MSQAAWPTTAQIVTHLAVLGVTSTLADAVMQNEIDGVVADWERLTGYTPFLGETQDATRYYDPPAWSGTPDQIDLRNGYISVTSVTAGVTPDSAGTVLTVNEDYWLLPDAAPSDNRPYTRIAFSVLQGGPRRSIKVIGKRGYCSTIAEDVWNAVRDRVCSNLFKLESGALLVTGRLKQDKLEMESGNGQFDDRYQKLSLNYARVAFGGRQ